MSDTFSVDDEARWKELQSRAWEIGKRPIQELSQIEIDFCGAFWRAKAAKRELAAARLKAGSGVVVPLEPTQAMQDAMLDHIKAGIAIDDDAHRSIRHAYRAMLSARPK